VRFGKRVAALTEFAFADRPVHHWTTVVVRSLQVHQAAAFVEEVTVGADFDAEFAAVVHDPLDLLGGNERSLYLLDQIAGLVGDLMPMRPQPIDDGDDADDLGNQPTRTDEYVHGYHWKLARSRCRSAFLAL